LGACDTTQGQVVLYIVTVVIRQHLIRLDWKSLSGFDLVGAN
jgi:hypothetical protein